MQLKEKNRNEIVGHKKRLDIHKKAIESDVSNSNMLSSNSNMAVGANPQPASAGLCKLTKSARLVQQTQSVMPSKEVTTQEKTVKDNLTTKKKTTKKRIVDKKALKEKQKAVAEKVMDDAREGKINIEKDSLEEERESKVVISKEERAERFKRLHAIAQGMMKKWNE